MLRIRARKRLRDFDLDVALDVQPGITLLIGPNGAGKTTLLRAVAGLTPLDEGQIELAGTTLERPPDLRLAPGRREVAFIFQEHALFDHLTVAQNIGYGLEARRIPRPARDAAVLDMLERFELGYLANERPGMLSGGQRQRVALARALVLQPKAVLLDEPLAALDLQTKIAVRAEIGRILGSLGVPALFVTHDPAEASVFNARLVALEKGRVTAEGTLDELRATAKDGFVHDFAGQVPAAAVQPTSP